MIHWIVASNANKYDPAAALRVLPEIDWTETSNAHIAVGDSVFLYGTSPTQALTHECIVVRTGIPLSDSIDDRQFWASAEAFDQRGARTWMRLRPVHTFDDLERTDLGLPELTRRGLKGAPQGRTRMPDSLISWIRHERHAIGALTRAPDSIASELAAIEAEVE